MSTNRFICNNDSLKICNLTDCLGALLKYSFKFELNFWTICFDLPQLTSAGWTMAVYKAKEAYIFNMAATPFAIFKIF